MVLKKEKDYNIKFLENEPGTEMYLAAITRNGQKSIIEKVKYMGFEAKFVTRDYYEPKMIGPVFWEEPEFNVKFSHKGGKKGDFSLRCKWWDETGGNRSFAYDEHLECGTDMIRGEITDVYFTTNPEKFKNYLTDHLFSGYSPEEGFRKEREAIEKRYQREMKQVESNERAYKKMIETANKFIGNI